MSLVTLFSAPKPFTDPHIALIQRNAIQSWTRLPDVAIILLGDEPGLAQTARELGVRHILKLERNSKGTPLLSSMFELARHDTDSPLLCAVNADMILLQDLVDAARAVAQLRDTFVLLSRRWDLQLVRPLEFTNGWQSALRATVAREGTLHRPAGSDYFLFPRSCFEDVPPFAIGRGGWDNWMIYEARRQGWPVIDCTPSVLVVHQAHNYGHLPGGEPHYTSAETAENIRLAGGQAVVRYTIVDASHRLVAGRLRPPLLSRMRLERGLEIFLRRLFFFLPEGRIESLVRPKRWRKRLRNLIGNRRP